MRISMVITALLGISLAFVARLGAQTYERKVEKQFNVIPSPIVEITNRFGPVKVRTASTNVVMIKVIIRMNDESMEEAKRLAEELNVDIKGSGKKVTVDIGSISRSGECHNCGQEIRIMVLVPKGTALSVENKFGSIEVDGVRGSVNVEGKFGSIEVTQCSNATIENAFGSITVTGIEGTLSIQGKNGKIRASDIEGGDFENAYGSTEITGTKRPVTVESKMGSVKVKDIVGGRVTNAYGSVEVWLSKSFEGTIEAKTSFGSVKSDVAMEEKQKRDRKSYGSTKEHLIGIVGSGPAKLFLETKFGDVTIRK